MTLKADRQVDSVELGFFINEIADGGEVLSVSTTGSGVALDPSTNVATKAASSSGAVPIGLLLQEVVNLDLTRTPVNWHKDQANTGDKVTLMRKGWGVTNKLTGTITVGEAVLSSSGTLASKAVDGTHNEAQNPTVGRFVSAKDEAGYAKVYIDL